MRSFPSHFSKRNENNVWFDFFKSCWFISCLSGRVGPLSRGRPLPPPTALPGRLVYPPSQSRREIRNRNYEKTKNLCNNHPRFDRQSQRPNTLKTKKLITNWIFLFSVPFACNKCFKKSSSKLCCGSVTFWYESGSADPYLWLTDPDSAPDPASVTFKTLTKYYQKSRFFLLFLLDDTVRTSD